MIEAVIYDMDGILIDSEPFWHEAEIKIFKKVNIELTNEMCTSTAGMRIDSVINHWYVKYPWDNYTEVEVAEMVMNEVKQLVETKGEALPGVYQSIELFKSLNLPLAIASSSHMRLIEAVVEKLSLKEHFDVIHSAENDTHGKPHPAVFLSAAEKLNVKPENCLVIEDTIFGVISGLAAKMKVVAVPEGENKSNDRFKVANLILDSLVEMNEAELTKLNS